MYIEQHKKKMSLTAHRRGWGVENTQYIIPSTISNVFSSETTGQIKAKLHVEHPKEGGTKVYINDPGHMTKMAMPIYGKKT